MHPPSNSACRRIGLGADIAASRTCRESRQPGLALTRSRSRAGQPGTATAAPYSGTPCHGQTADTPMAVPGPGPAPTQVIHNRKAPAQACTSHGGTADPGRADHHAARGTAKEHNPGGTTCP
jgi:hypothetical protein